MIDRRGKEFVNKLYFIAKILYNKPDSDAMLVKHEYQLDTTQTYYPGSKQLSEYKFATEYIDLSITLNVFYNMLKIFEHIYPDYTCKFDDAKELWDERFDLGRGYTILGMQFRYIKKSKIIQLRFMRKKTVNDFKIGFTYDQLELLCETI